jgi:hypothetical protein
MNTYDDISDHDVLRAAARSLSAVPAAGPPDVRGIMTRGSARRRRQLAGLGVTGVAAATATALGLAGALGAFAGGTPAARAGTIHTAAFTLSRNANGTATLRLTQPQVFDPQVLQRALAEDGIPALVTSNSWCWSSPALPSPSDLGKVVSVQTQNGIPVTPSTAQNPQPMPSDTVTVINPAELGSGTELLFDYLKQAPHGVLAASVIYTHAHTCKQGASPGQSGR